MEFYQCRDNGRKVNYLIHLKNVKRYIKKLNEKLKTTNIYRNRGSNIFENLNFHEI